MQRNQRITGFPDMGVHAGPALLFRQRNHRGAYRIQFDISAYHQCITIRFDQAGLEPTLPQGARPTMTLVEELDVALANSAHRNRQCFRPWWRQQQMDMIVHQNEGVNGNVVFETGFTQPSSVVMAILVVNEDRRPIHATLDDMKQNM